MNAKKTDTKKAQVALEFLTNLLLISIAVALFMNAVFAIEKQAAAETKKFSLLLKLQRLAQQFDGYLNSAYLSENERQHYLQTTDLGCKDGVCYRLVNNVVVAEYEIDGTKKSIVARTIIYKEVSNEPI
jgi:hypothetical protein